MSIARNILTHLVAPVDIGFDGARPWDLRVHAPDTFRRILLEGSLGLGESYVDGGWDCDDLEELARRVLRTGLESHYDRMPATLRVSLPSMIRNQQSRVRARRVAEQHYDLGNDLFTTFLGRYRNYSCGWFDGVEDLDAAQIAKMELIARKLDLQPGDRLLDIGGGWGEFARFAAECRGCKVTSINISDEQIAWARLHTQALATGSVEVIKMDYRDLPSRFPAGAFDKIASVAMLTHVGWRNYRTFMEITHRSLRSGGAMLVECVGGNVSKTWTDPWIDRYIFPGGLIPSIAQVGRSVEGLYSVEDLHNFGPHYVRTLRAWNANLHAAWPTLGQRYPERVLRMFRYFFLTVAAAFDVRQLQHWHWVLTPTGAPPPPRLRGR